MRLNEIHKQLWKKPTNRRLVGDEFQSGYELIRDKAFKNYISSTAKNIVSTHACNVEHGLHGECANLTYYFWKELGSPIDFWPYSVWLFEEEHVLLYSKRLDMTLDITSSQYKYPIISHQPKTLYSNNFLRLSKKEIQELTL